LDNASNRDKMPSKADVYASHRSPACLKFLAFSSAALTLASACLSLLGIASFTALDCLDSVSTALLNAATIHAGNGIPCPRPRQQRAEPWSRVTEQQNPKHFL